MDTDTARSRLEAERTRLIGLRDDEADSLDESQPDEIGEYARDPADGAQETSTREMEESVVASLDRQLSDVDAALERLDDGTYGRCEVCGKDIGDERLDAQPTARFCIEHQQQAERETRAGEWNQ